MKSATYSLRVEHTARIFIYAYKENYGYKAVVRIVEHTQ